MGLSNDEVTVLGVKYYLDGGSVEIKVLDERAGMVKFFTLDNREGSETNGRIFCSTIDFENQVEMTPLDRNILLKALEVYKRTLQFVMLDIQNIR